MNQETAKDRMLAAQKLYEDIKEDNLRLQNFKNDLDEIYDRMNKMLEYYESKWLEDSDKLVEANETIEVMGEDQIYEEIVSQDILIKEILLKCAEYLNTNL